MWFDMAKDRVSLPSRTSDVSSLADSLMTSHAYKKVRSQRFRRFEVFERISANGCQVHLWWTCTNPICSTTNLSIHFGDDDEEPDLWANLFSPTGTDAAHASKRIEMDHELGMVSCVNKVFILLNNCISFTDTYKSSQIRMQRYKYDLVSLV